MRSIDRVVIPLGLMVLGNIGLAHAAQGGVPGAGLLAERVRDTPTLLCGVVQLCLAAAYMALWREASDFRVFKLMGLYLAVSGVQQFGRYFDGMAWDWVFPVMMSPLIVAAAGEAMRVRHRKWALWLWPICALVLVLGETRQGLFLRSWPVDVSQVALAVLIAQRFRTAKSGALNRRDLWIAGAFTLFFLVRWTVSADLRQWTSIPQFVQIGGWRWYFTNPTIILLGVVTLAACVRDLLDARREEERLTAEGEAGRAVRQLLESASRPADRRWQVDCVYSPAAQFGGDFYALLERTPETRMLVIGDVSGKGLRAAMVVSTILGALRQDAGGGPADVLRRLNRTMVQSGFGDSATCLCAVLGREPELCFANAGHLTPYVNGTEIEAEGSLPLGLVAEAQYSEHRVTIAPGERVLLLSNGVVDAQNASGERFGFQRTRLLSRLSAAEMAAAAQRYGQVDDITVVTITRTAGAEACDVMAEAAAVATPA